MLGRYLRILGAPSVQSYCTLSISASEHVFVCGRYCKSRLSCRTWISLDIARFHEEPFQPSSGSAWPAFPKTVNRVPIAGGRRVDTICTVDCQTAMTAPPCVDCRLEPLLYLYHSLCSAIHLAPEICPCMNFFYLHLKMIL